MKKKDMSYRFPIYLALIVCLALIFSYEGGGAVFLTIVILSVSAIYVLGLLRLWRNAGAGHGLPVWRAACFLGGMTILAISLIGPMDKLAEQALSMHMVQHMLLMKVVPPLLLLGEFSPMFLWAVGKNTAQGIAGTWTHSRSLVSFWKQLTSPWTTWTLFALSLWIWHIPVLYQAALTSKPLHNLEHAMFLGTSLLFWWYLLQPGNGQVIRYGAAVLYLFTTLLHESVLGALLTFSSKAWYSLYAGSHLWGLSPLSDQQLAGMIMWVPGGILFGILIVFYFGAWLQTIEKRTQHTQPELMPAGDSDD